MLCYSYCRANALSLKQMLIVAVICRGRHIRVETDTRSRRPFARPIGSTGIVSVCQAIVDRLVYTVRFIRSEVEPGHRELAPIVSGSIHRLRSLSQIHYEAADEDRWLAYRVEHTRRYWEK